MQFEKKGGTRDQRLLERLLICALIEARSCERYSDYYRCILQKIR